MRREDGNHFPGNHLTGNPAVLEPPTYCPECGRKLRLVGHSYQGRFWPKLICRGWATLALAWLVEDALSHYVYRLPLDSVPDRFDRQTGVRVP